MIDADAIFQTPTSAARLTGLSAKSIRQGCKDGSIPHIMVGRDFRINMPLWRAQMDAASLGGGDA